MTPTLTTSMENTAAASGVPKRAEKGADMPHMVVGRLAFLAGLRPTAEPVSPGELVPAFSWDKVPREDIVVPADWLDENKV